MRPTILFWALIMHCHPQECAFANWARAHENDPHDAVIDIYRTFKECEADKPRDNPVNDRGYGESYTCEILKISINGGQIVAVKP